MVDLFAALHLNGSRKIGRRFVGIENCCRTKLGHLDASSLCSKKSDRWLRQNASLTGDETLSLILQNAARNLQYKPHVPYIAKKLGLSCDIRNKCLQKSSNYRLVPLD